MRLVSSSIERRTGEGRAKLEPEEPEDMVSNMATYMQLSLTIVVACIQSDQGNRPRRGDGSPTSHQDFRLGIDVNQTRKTQDDDKGHINIL